jgi:uncharacterized SAM-binding protein YcdF (DUF218 family)
MADPPEPNKQAERFPPAMPDARPDPDAALLRRDMHHSLAVSALAVLLSGGLLYLAYLLRVCWVALHSPPQAADGDSILVFGKRLQQGRPDADYRMRLARAHALAVERPERGLILLGGGPPGASEAEAGLQALRALGLPADVAVRLEDQSLDTLQNLRNARAMLADARSAPVLLLSSRYHLARCLSLARRLGFDARPCAAEARFRLREQRAGRLLHEAALLCWLEVGAGWARLIGHRRMLERVS